MTKALYAFSGDPLTNGHKDIVQRTASIFDEVEVGIGVNPDKNYTFALDERVTLAARALAHLSNVRVTSFTGLTVDYAYAQHIPVIVKGVRDATDWTYESILHNVGATQGLEIDTMLLLARPELVHVSSSAAKALLKEQGDIHHLVPLNVKQALEARVLGQYFIGITGEIASGKSTLSKQIVSLAQSAGIPAHHVDIDKIGHAVLEDTREPRALEVQRQIASLFGDSVRGNNGGIDRKSLGNKVFGNPEKLAQLNALLHPPILSRLRHEVHSKQGLILLESALFSEEHLGPLVNNNLVLVTTNKDQQYTRLTERGFSPDQILRRQQSQQTTTEKQHTLETAIAQAHHGQLFFVDSSEKTNAVSLQFLHQIIQHLDVYGELRFHQLWHHFGGENARDAYVQLIRHYTAPGRFHHAWTHVLKGWVELEDSRFACEHIQKVQLAYVGHDAIYVPLAHDNEVQSALFIGKLMTAGGIHEQTVRDVQSITTATTHQGIPRDNNERAIVDADLAILGAPLAEFNAYESGIRREYAMVPEDIFNKERARILQRFLDREHIFYTKHMQEKYEVRARLNLKRSVKQLQKKS